MSFIFDSQGISYRNQTIIQLVLYVFGWLCLIYVIWFYVKDTNYFEEPNVIVPKKVDEQALISGLVFREILEREAEKEEEARKLAAKAKTDEVSNKSRDGETV